MTDKNGGAAFPVPMSQQSYDNQQCEPYQTGMDLRDYFAARAMQAYMQWSLNEPIHEDDDRKKAAARYAKIGYEIADAMIAAR